MKANPDKCYFIFSTDHKINLSFENETIFNSPCEKLLGVSLDSSLTFGSRINDICKMTGLKLNALARTTSYPDFNKKQLILYTFFM